MRMTIVSINKLLSSELEALDGQLKARSQTKVEMINTLSDHIISSGGKRLRPIVLMLSKVLSLFFSYHKQSIDTKEFSAFCRDLQALMIGRDRPYRIRIYYPTVWSAHQSC